jgi:hypothetical protein
MYYAAAGIPPILSIGAKAQHMHWSISMEISSISDFVYIEFTILLED